MSEKMIKRNGTNGKTFVLCIAVILMLLALATPVSAKVASVDFRQCANNDHAGPGNCWWINSIVQNQNSEYYEGMSTLQRLILTDITPTTGNVHTLTFSHKAVKSSANAHSYDFLTSWDQAVAAADAIAPRQNLLGGINECGDEIGSVAYQACVSLHDTGTFVDVPLPDNMGTILGGDVAAKVAAYETRFGDRTFTIYSQSAITDAIIAFNGYTSGSDPDATYTLTWTSASPAILIELAGHISVGTDYVGAGIGYGPGLGAGSIPGGSYHVSMDLLDGQALGSIDNQLKDVDIPPCAGVDCDDGIECTDDSCDTVTGDCVFTNDNTNTCGSNSDTDCDNPDTCVAGVCQENHEPTTTVCRAAGGICDVPETCSADGTCPDDSFVDEGTECRASGGICDVPEECTGAGALCPDDSFVDEGTECRASGGICDVPEECTGAGALCPDDSFVDEGTECRESANTCDPAEECTGDGALCPTDITWDDALCTEWCGLTQGFWKENTDKYLSAWATGRQVCDQYFVDTDPSLVCNVISGSPCSCNAATGDECKDWTCISKVFNAKGKAQDMTKIQMMALYMTQEYHVTGIDEPPFYIDCTKFNDECSATFPDNMCVDGQTAQMSEIWTYLQANPSAGLADCLNNYNDGQCSIAVDYPSCDEDPLFVGLSGCNGGTKKITMKLS